LLVVGIRFGTSPGGTGRRRPDQAGGPGHLPDVTKCWQGPAHRFPDRR
jgi:hypothetical protein